ncbi:hypothetical protein BH09BAC1_BH09BAC1_27580 [soil metagenome]
MSSKILHYNLFSWFIQEIYYDEGTKFTQYGFISLLLLLLTPVNINLICEFTYYK